MPKDKYADIRIRSRSFKLKREMLAIAKSKGQTMSGFWKSELMKLVDTYPDSARNYKDTEDDGC